MNRLVLELREARRPFDSSAPAHEQLLQKVAVQHLFLPLFLPLGFKGSFFLHFLSSFAMLCFDFHTPIQLWHVLNPDKRGHQHERRGPHWKEIGFQGSDPSTDFRGAGLLGLQNLVDFASRYPLYATDVLRASNQPNW